MLISCKKIVILAVYKIYKRYIVKIPKIIKYIYTYLYIFIAILCSNLDEKITNFVILL